ncbi:transposase domain-containing protein [Sphingobium lignivorans]|uniref:HTH Mu-type domain-containing protein n=1 Tax=Sphingobium lignivorans TaxID=2735886 RepID=A0ABR6NJF0_9SPHN|nr:transposase domain-containing protein [Sphingobium lignivorans]MBB5987406.1 hypothetical protein [Sphingobium lignivorans]
MATAPIEDRLPLDEATMRAWFTAAELAELRLPGLPTDKRAVNRRARDERWQYRTDASGALLSRPRAGRGGGTEFHVSLLPGAARLELARRGIGARPAPAEAEAQNGGSWRWYDGQTAKTKAEAERRLAIIAELHLQREAGETWTAAVAAGARRHSVGSSTLWSWLRLVEGVARPDWLPALAPRRKGGGAEAPIDPELWHIYKSDCLRASSPTFTSCYERTADIAAQRGLSLPSERTLRRRLESEVHPSVLRLAREGEEALRRSIPAQRRTVEHLRALEWVNVDGHKFDVTVGHPVTGKPIRPVMVALQDIHSSKVLAWRVGETESAALARMAFADLIRNWGIPKHCLLDNGRGFASKWLTGGARTRFRFKIRDEEPTGLLTALGVNIHWALPYRGQSKPIERAFRDLCDTIGRSPDADGAYTGNNPMNKPHNYGSKVMRWADFLALVDREIARHNARLGRKGRHYAGRSFDEVFAASYATADIGKASPDHLRQALLAAEQKRVNRQTGEVELFGNRYWAPGCDLVRGQLVTVRFDPDDLHGEVHLYGQDGAYLTTAPVIMDTGFDNVAGAKATGKRWAEHRKRIRDGLAAEQLIAAEELARLLPAAAEPSMPEPSVLRTHRHRGQTAAALRAAPEPKAAQEAAPNPEFNRLAQRAALRLIE